MDNDELMMQVPVRFILETQVGINDGACATCNPKSEFTMPGFVCVYHRARRIAIEAGWRVFK